MNTYTLKKDFSAKPQSNESSDLRPKWPKRKDF